MPPLGARLRRQLVLRLLLAGAGWLQLMRGRRVSLPVHVRMCKARLVNLMWARSVGLRLLLLCLWRLPGPMLGQGLVWLRRR